MPLAAAFLVPGCPLPYLRPDVGPWTPLATACRRAGELLALQQVDTLLVYSTQWIAVLDELWQMRGHVHGLHVDENWYEFGDLPFDLRVDTEVTAAAIAATTAFGVRSKGVDYEGFPIDTGTVVANGFLNAGGKARLVIASNNVYHDWATTERLAASAAAAAESMGRRYAVVGVGGLSGALFREEIDLQTDHVASAEDDALNRDLLSALDSPDVAAIRRHAAEHAGRTRADMGLKHLAWILGAVGERYVGAETLAYGPTYGSGAAVIHFKLRAPG